MTPPRSSEPRVRGNARCQAAGCVATAAPVAESSAGAVAASSRCASASPASRSRRFCSRSKHRRRSHLSGAGVVVGSTVRSRSRSSTFAITCATVSPVNSRCPVSISNSTTPKDQMSLRLSAVRPAACSGDIYAAVPMIMPICVAAAVSVGDCDGSLAGVGSSALAKPKSNTLTVPSSRTLMFAGLRSRWITPASWAASSASAICLAIGSASSSGIGPFEIRSARVGPSTSSRTSARVPSASSMP